MGTGTTPTVGAHPVRDQPAFQGTWRSGNATVAHRVRSYITAELLAALVDYFDQGLRSRIE